MRYPLSVHRGTFAFAVLVPLVACGLTVEGTAGPGGGAEDDGGRLQPDGSPVLPIDDAGGAAPGDAGGDVAPSPSCKGTAGPTPIRVDTFCVDRTEVTRAQYAAFLAAATTEGQPAHCSWNVSFGTVASSDELPMTNIDWCDARAFCAWAGKRLCTASESRSACSSGGRKYPYGTTYVAGRCNDATAVKAGPVAAGSLTCTSELGVHDMIGNVWEWVDKCSGTTGANDACAFGTGGAWGHLYDCDQTASGFVRQSKALDVGFRCCSDLE